MTLKSPKNYPKNIMPNVIVFSIRNVFQQENAA